MTTILRYIFVHLARLFPREHGKYTILTKIYFRFFGQTVPTQIVASVRYKIRMNLDLREFVQAWIYVFGAYELPTVKFIRSYLAPNDVALDVGAQVGYLSLIMATSAQRRVKVFSFEPESRNIYRFLLNMSLNDANNVNLIEKAAGTKVETLKLYLSSDVNAGTHSTIRGNQNVSDAFVEIPCTTIDQTVNDSGLDRVDLIKIDVEGAEVDVLRGALNTLTSMQPVLITELGASLQEARGMTTTQFKLFLSELGYQCYRILDDGTLTLSPLDEYHRMDNVVFATANRRDRLPIR